MATISTISKCAMAAVKGKGNSLTACAAGVSGLIPHLGNATTDLILVV
jgi:hypothetical protein